MNKPTELDARLAWFKRERGRLTITMHPATGWNATTALSTYESKTTNEPDFEAIMLWLERVIGEYQAEMQGRHVGRRA